VDATQKQKIYTIQAQYEPQIDALKKQLDDLIAKEKAEIRAVLTPEQRKQLDQTVGDTSKAKSSKKGAADGADMKKS
jgi:Spy/CpxP family protein refolding chaperone